MTVVLIRHRIKDYNNWKVVFDSHNEIRKNKGEKSYQIFKSTDDSNNLFLVFTWENVERAKDYFNSTVLKDAMRKAGVVEIPDVHIIEEVARGTNHDLFE